MPPDRACSYSITLTIVPSRAAGQYYYFGITINTEATIHDMNALRHAIIVGYMAAGNLRYHQTNHYHHCNTTSRLCYGVCLPF